MRQKISGYAEKMRKERKFRRRMGGLFLVLALLVTAGVFWGLKLTGLSMNKNLICGKEEHVHTEECYERVLICGQEESDPAVADAEAESEEESAIDPESMTDPESDLTKAELDATEAEESVSPLNSANAEAEAYSAHVHTEACYEMRQICGQEEHTHGESCYQKAAEEDGAESLPGEETPSGDNEDDNNIEETPTEENSGEALEGITGAEGIMPLAVLPDTVIDGGAIEGTDISWEVTEDTEGAWTLTISGAGDIPNYSETDIAPWRKYLTTAPKGGWRVVVEENITSIGDHAFCYSKATEYELPKTLESIGKYAFEYNQELKSIVIPESVGEIKGSCFFMASKLSDITLQEGLHTIGNSIFDGTSLKVLSIPASLKNKGGFGNPSGLERIVVADGNPVFRSIDGVLFEKMQNGKWQLTKYPPRLVGDSEVYEVPEAFADGSRITRIGTAAFMGTNYLREVTVPAGIEEIVLHAFWYSGFTKIVLKMENLSGGSEAFRSSALTEVEFPYAKGKLPVNFLLDCSNLSSVTIPKGITGLESGVFNGCISLEQFTYNAASATWGVNNLFDKEALFPRFALTIGSDVDTLPAEFTQIASRADSIIFAPSNQLTIAPGAFSGAPAPVSDLSGDAWVDANGVVYTYGRNEAGEWTAEVAYCPAGMTERTIPASIEALNGDGTTTSYTVTSVKDKAFTLATDLTSVTFLGKDAITSIGVKAFYGLSGLTSVNGMTTVEEAESSFGNGQAQIGSKAFANTGLGNASGSGFDPAAMDGQKQLEVGEDKDVLNISVVGSEGQTISWPKDKEGSDLPTGGYTLLTGDNLNVNLSIGNTDHSEEKVYRVYFRRTEEDLSLSIQKDGTYTFGKDGNTITAHCYGTADPDVLYLEFAPSTGGTVTIPVAAVYLSPASRGGGLQIWGVIKNQADAEGSKGELVNPADNEMIEAWWKTQEDPFLLTKTSSENVGVTGDGQGNAIPSKDLSWKIDLSRNTDVTNEHYGKDYVRSVEYQDVLQFPEHMGWKEEVETAIRNKTIRWRGNECYAGNVKVLTLTSSTAISSRSLTWNEDLGAAVLKWRHLNADSTKELSVSPMTLSIAKDAVRLDAAVLGETSFTVTNTVDATVHYHYAADAPLTSTAEKTLTVNQGAITLKKDIVSSGKYFGEDVTYEVTLSNSGATNYTGDQAGVYRVEDKMSERSYIKPANLDRMFQEDPYGANLTVTIENVSLASWQPITGVDGEKSSYTNSANSGVEDTENSGVSLELTFRNGSYQVTVKEGETVTQTYSGSSTAAEALQEAGYAVNAKDQYLLTWSLNEAEEPFVLTGGETRIFRVYGTVKDTFQLLEKDWPTEWPQSETLRITNNTWIRRPDGTTGSSTSKSHDVLRECFVAKDVSRDGEMLKGAFDASDGDVLDYQLHFTHYGKGVYQDLPMVDDLYGSQYLLVPVTENPGLADAGLKSISGDGKDYYILTEGDYSDICVGEEDGELLTAAFIHVTNTKTPAGIQTDGEEHTYTGLHTQIKWYFPEMSGENGKAYERKISYKALVDKSLAAGQTYELGNQVWMNDQEGSRIYAGLWGGGSIIDFEKKILARTPGAEDLDGDGLDDDDYTLIRPGEQVTYRIILSNAGNGTVTLNGADLADSLPDTYHTELRPTFTWAKGTNVTLEASVGTGSIDLNGIGDWTVEDSWLGIASEGKQYILWPETSSIVFHGEGTLYLDVTLTYPKNGDGNAYGDDAWDRYAAAVGGKTITNTLYVYRFPSNVTHNLRESGRVLLQKGVFGTGYYISSNTNAGYYDAPGRQYYNNKAGSDRFVAYYAVVCNDGNKRLYLSDLQDRLPRGFTYQTLVKDDRFIRRAGNNVNYSTINRLSTISGSAAVALAQNALVELPDGMTLKNALITAIPSNTDNRVIFQVGAGSGENAVSYDEERQAYYLDKGEGLVFGYVCFTGDFADTEDRAKNTLAMPYDDYLDTGVSVVSSLQLPVTGAESERHPDYNDGERWMESAAQVRDNYGFTDEAGDAQWLVSDVTVIRGGIVPGVTKYTDSSTLNSTTEKYTNSVNPFATVNWRVSLDNSGEQTMTNYIFTDILPEPYTFTGPLVLTNYDANGNIYVNVGKPITLCEIQEHKLEDENISVVFQGTTYSLTRGEPKVLGTGRTFTISTTADGREMLTLAVEDPSFYILNGGHAEITLSGVNVSGTYLNAVYTNQALLTPGQVFEKAGQGVLIPDENGDPESVRNSAPVNVAYGLITSSEKRVTEVENPDNTAVSTDPDHNTILLSAADRAFRYSLTVDNKTEGAMKKLVLIDNLPEVGDHSPFDREAERGSAFAVHLAEKPDFELAITDPKGEIHVLEKEKYSVEYSKDTYFGGRESPDWSGKASGTNASWTADNAWTDPLSEVRSIRIVLLDDTETLIPSDAKVTFSFTAQAEGAAEPGSVAWNSFGYHYAVRNTELEAMPYPVGVKVPVVPELQKKVVDAKGDACNVTADAEFHFLIYTGEKLAGTYRTEAELTAALRAEDPAREYRKVSLRVNAGESESEVQKLISANLLAPAGTAEDWIWRQGEQYTITELPDEDPDTSNLYRPKKWNGVAGDAYTFTYDRGTTLELSCTNEYLPWDLLLTKKDLDDTDKTLPGTVFAIYSPAAGDQLDELRYAELTQNLKEKPDLHLNAENEDWYLKDIQITDSRGEITWADLTEERYYLMEVEAPEGYNKDWPARVVTRSGNKAEVTAMDSKGFTFPLTGGPGTRNDTAWGAAILLAAAGLWVYRRKTGFKRPGTKKR